MENKVIELEPNQEYPVILTGQELVDYYTHLKFKRESLSSSMLTIDSLLTKLTEQIEQFKSKTIKE
jgi:hypothetical protein